MEKYKEIIDKISLLKVSLESVEEMDDYDILTIHGGLNGSGDFHYYLTQILAIVLQFESELNVNDIWLIDWINDCPDDVWTLRIGVRK